MISELYDIGCPMRILSFTLIALVAFDLAADDIFDTLVKGVLEMKKKLEQNSRNSGPSVGRRVNLPGHFTPHVVSGGLGGKKAPRMTSAPPPQVLPKKPVNLWIEGNPVKAMCESPTKKNIAYVVQTDRQHTVYIASVSSRNKITTQFNCNVYIHYVLFATENVIVYTFHDVRNHVQVRAFNLSNRKEYNTTPIRGARALRIIRGRPGDVLIASVDDFQRTYSHRANLSNMLVYNN